MLKILKNCLYIIVSSIILCSCGGGSNGGNKTTLNKLTSITIDQAPIVNTNVGLKTKITATAHYSDNTTKPINSTELSLFSANSNIASISASIGSNEIFVVGVAAGETTITASFNGIKSNETTVKVSAATIQSIEIDQGSEIDTNVGLQTTITATAYYSDNTIMPIPNADLTLVSANPGIAKVINGFFVMGVNTGQTTITASFNGIQSSETTVTVSNASMQFISIDQGSTIDTHIGIKTQLTATAHFSDGTVQPIANTDLKFVSAIPSIASIMVLPGSNQIFIMGVSAGETTITASFNDFKSVETKVNVGNAIVQSVTIDQAPTIYTNINFRAKVTATAHFSDETTQPISSTDLKLVSTNPEIAEVISTNEDFVMGVAAGETTITASFNGIKSNETTVQVSAATIRFISIDQGVSVFTKVGLKTKITVTAYFSDGTNRSIPSIDLNLVSRNSKVAKIVSIPGSNDIYVMGVTANKYTVITASFNNIKSSPVFVYVK